MHALARRWAARNAGSGRVLRKQDLDRIFSGRDTAPLYLRIEDPFERYQRQGVGFTWSFFTQHDLQDRHVHGAPAVEIYGVLSGKLEIWWKNYQDRGVSAWRSEFLGEGDWFELAGYSVTSCTSSRARGAAWCSGPGWVRSGHRRDRRPGQDGLRRELRLHPARPRQGADREGQALASIGLSGAAAGRPPRPASEPGRHDGDAARADLRGLDAPSVDLREATGSSGGGDGEGHLSRRPRGRWIITRLERTWDGKAGFRGGLELVEDGAGGWRAIVENPNFCAGFECPKRAVARSYCPVFDVRSEARGWGWQRRGHARIDCSFPEGGTRNVDLTFRGCAIVTPMGGDP
jgi:hypothetical protein